MKFRKLLYTALLSAGCMSASAQAPETVTVEAFNPHWFVQAQAGAQYTLGEVCFGDLVSPNIQVAGGYQFTPVWGLRLAVNAWQSKGGSDGFSIKRRLAGTEEEFTEVAQVSTPSFSDESLPSNTGFEYRIDSLLDTGEAVTESRSKVLNIKTKASLSRCTCDIRPVYRFTGRRVEPDLNVMLNGTKLVRDVDYIVKYYNNISAGTATVSVTGCGQYFGFKEFDFEISLSGGYIVPEKPLNDLRFAGDSIERYEVLAFTPDNIPNFTAPIANRESDSPIVVEINSAKNTDGLRIVSRRKSSSNVMPCFDAWY